MAIRTETYALARPAPYLLERNVSQTITAPIRHGSTGALVAPASGTITIKRPDGTSYLSAQAVTVSSSTAQYTLTPSATESLGGGWTVEWTLVFSSVTYPVFSKPAVLCEFVPPNNVSVLDLYRGPNGIPELEHRIPQAQGVNGDDVGWQPQIDAAYYELIRKMVGDGKRLHLAVDGWYEWLCAVAKRNCLAAVSAGPDSTWARHARDNFFECQRAEARLKIHYSDDSAGIRRGQGVIWLAPVGRPPWP